MGLRMNRRLLTILLSAFVVAAACAFLVYRIVNARLNAPHQSATTRVVAASQDLKIGTVLRPTDLTAIEIAGPLPKGALLDQKLAVGRGVISNLYQGEPILEARLAAPGSGGGLAATIRPGMRACAIKVDEVVGVAGFVTPGMRVDVLISGTPPGQTNNSTTTGPLVRTLLQNIEVLSAGTDIQKDAEGKPQQVQVVNLLVTPDDAETLSLASSQTHIQLVLRNPLDTTTAVVSGSAVANLYGSVQAAPVKTKAAAPKAPKAPTEPFKIEIINGSKHSEEKFASPGGIQ